MQPRDEKAELIPLSPAECDVFAADIVHGITGDPLQVGKGVADLLQTMLSLDFAYLRLKPDTAQGHIVEVARTIHEPTTEAQTRAIGEALAPWLHGIREQVVGTATNLNGNGTVRVMIVPLGCEGQEGVLAAGSRQSGFPGDKDRLLLNVVAQQAVTSLQSWRTHEVRAQLQRERDELLARLRLQFERMPIACIVMDQQLHIIDWNPAAEEIFGYRREEALGKNGELLLVPPAGREHTGEIIRRVVAGDMMAYATNENITKDGRAIVCDWHNTPLRGSDGEIVAIMSMAQDVTERARTEEKLIQSQSLAGRGRAPRPHRKLELGHRERQGLLVGRTLSHLRLESAREGADVRPCPVLHPPG